MLKRDCILNKIDKQEMEWDRQVHHLQSKVAGFDSEKRLKLEKYVNHLHSKLGHIKTQTNALRIASDRIWEKYADSIAETWEELVHNVDYVISGYNRILD